MQPGNDNHYLPCPRTTDLKIKAGNNFKKTHTVMWDGNSRREKNKTC